MFFSCAKNATMILARTVALERFYRTIYIKHNKKQDVLLTFLSISLYYILVYVLLTFVQMMFIDTFLGVTDEVFRTDKAAG